MLFGRVKGSAVCTLKYPGTEGLKLLVVQPLNKKLQPVGPLQVAADVVDAGPGDLCVMVRSREAALALPDVKFVPIDLALVGIVDELVVLPDQTFDFTLKKGWTAYTLKAANDPGKSGWDRGDDNQPPRL
jgi:ethanolamine utilization protein EutN